MSVTYPLGFRAAGVAAGLKPSGNLDLGLLVAEADATATGLFTTNAFAAAPVVLGRERLAGGAPRAVLVNSGQANAATGERGLADAVRSTAAVADLLGLAPEQVLPCSTGVIGEPVHMDELLEGAAGLGTALSREGGDAFARAILTTDTIDKQATADAARYRVGGCAKGVGMISPNLATMLVFVTTDAPLDRVDLGVLSAEQLAPRFTSLTVDGCSSTNDTVLCFASGAAGGPPVVAGTPAWDDLSAAVGRVAESLLLQLVADAEGGTHILLIEVGGAASEGDARAVAKAVADSPLVKTAAFGGDPNPGRILQAVGSAGVGLDPRRVRATIGGAVVAEAGTIPAGFFAPGNDRHAEAAAAMKETEIHITVDLGMGNVRSRAIGCDLSYDYVRINGEYTT